MQAFLTQCPLCESEAARDFVSFESLRFLQCIPCGLIYKGAMDPAIQKAYDASYFEDGRAKYARRFEHRVRKCSRQLRLMLDAPGLPESPRAADASQRLLDVGCSAGYVMEAGQRLGLQAEGLDPSEHAVSLCLKRGLKASVGTLDALPFEDGAFDLITLKHTLEHVAAPLQALSELRRVLAPGGRLLVVVPDAAYWKRSLMRRRGGYFRPDRAGAEHHVYFEEHQLVDAGARVGLKAIHRDKAYQHRFDQGGDPTQPPRARRGVRAGLSWLRYTLTRSARALVIALHLRREIQVLFLNPLNPSKSAKQALA